MFQISRFAATFSNTGVILGLGFFCASLTPSLLPRVFTMQGVLSGVAFATGYGIGKVLYWLYRYMELKDIPENSARIVNRVLISSLLAVTVFTLSRTLVWQNSVRIQMEMEAINYVYPLAVLPVAVLTALAVILLMRLLLHAGKKAVALVNRYMPRRISIVIGSIAFMLLVSSFVDKIILKAALHVMDKSFAATNRLLDEAYEPPRDSLASGGSGSLIFWEDIGRNGKRFVADGPKQADIASVTGRNARPPIRVYAGFDTEETLQERARIALAELKRVDGFERSILIIATATGTGWLDPSAVDTVEFIHAGDTAIVALQYSYLPSWLTLMIEPELAKEAAAALFREVYNHWTTLPKNKRPRLYLYGLSLGALGSESSTQIISLIADPIDGALWAGPPFPSTIWKRLTALREPGSPQWRPLFGDNSMIRFMTQDGFPEQATAAEWSSLRIIYLQHASDPMTWFSPDLAFKMPDWLGRNRGRDVSPYFRWFPVVSSFQVAFDILAATRVQIGYGHNFAPDSYIDAWIEVTQPRNWREMDTENLKTHFIDFNPNPM